MSDYEGRPASEEYAAAFAPYVARVPAGGIVEVLGRQVAETRELLAGLSEAEAEYAYAPGKWTIKEVVGHLSDSERVFAYRALRFARGDRTELASFDDQLFARTAESGKRTLASLLEEFDAVRRATVALLAGLPAEVWTARGVASGQETSVRGLACVIAGHELHHRALLEERYLGASTTPGTRG